MLRLLLADHRRLFRLGIAAALAASPQIELFAPDVYSHTLALLVYQLSPDVLFLNLRLPKLDLPALSLALACTCPTLTWLFLLEPGDEWTTNLQLLLQNGGGRNYLDR